MSTLSEKNNISVLTFRPFSLFLFYILILFNVLMVRQIFSCFVMTKTIIIGIYKSTTVYPQHIIVHFKFMLLSILEFKYKYSKYIIDHVDLP